MNVFVAAGIYPPEGGGPATYAVLLEHELPKRGLQVDLLAFREVRHLPKFLRHAAYFRRVLKRARKADLIYAQDAVSVGFPAMLANIFLHKRFVVKIVGDHTWEQGRQRFGITAELDAFPRWSDEWPLMLRFIRRAQFFVVHRADRIVVPSQYLRRIVLSWGIPEHKVVCIYNSVASEEAPVPPTEYPKSPLIVTSARLVPWKGIDGLIEVIAQEQNWNLAVINDGPMRAELESMVRERKLNKRVQFLGSMSNAEALGWYQVADVFVLNSSYEGLSHVLLEALRLGKPIVATNVGGNPELIEDGVSGILIPPGDVGALRVALGRIIENPALARVLAAGALRRSEDFSLTKTMDQLCSLLKAI